jgi:hypothetical protein
MALQMRENWRELLEGIIRREQQLPESVVPIGQMRFSAGLKSVKIRSIRVIRVLCLGFDSDGLVLVARFQP